MLLDLNGSRISSVNANPLSNAFFLRFFGNNSFIFNPFNCFTKSRPIFHGKNPVRVST